MLNFGFLGFRNFVKWIQQKIHFCSIVAVVWPKVAVSKPFGLCICLSMKVSLLLYSLASLP